MRNESQERQRLVLGDAVVVSTFGSLFGAAKRVAAAWCWRHSVQNGPWMQRQQASSRAAFAAVGAGHGYNKSRRNSCLRKVARVLLGLETADAKVHRRSRPAAMDVISNSRIDSGGSKLLGCCCGWEVRERSISAGKEHWQVSPAGEAIATAKEGLAPPGLNRSPDLFGVSRRRRRDVATKRR
ncbi:hypothetical protein GW17_00060277 [Ensete ventricosum]|nr:hypothetical protein GW17_00060277 [Ensete ventricosum]